MADETKLPPEYAAKAAEVAGRGTKDLAAFTQEMIAECGEEVRPHIYAIFQHVVRGRDSSSDAEPERFGQTLWIVGLGRLGYFLWLASLTITARLVTLAVAPSTGLLLFWLWVAAGFAIGALRLRSIGRPLWLLVFAVIPIANLVIGYQLLAYPPNYASTKEADRPMKIIRGIYLAVIGLLVIAMIIPFLQRIK